MRFVGLLFVGLVYLFASWSISAQAIFLPMGDEQLPRIDVHQAVYGWGNDYAEVRNLSLEILTQFPPQDYMYVAVGRSPSPIVAFLKAYLGENSIYSFPISNMTHSEVVLERLSEHARFFLPELAEVKSRKILLIDFANSGGTLKKTQRFLEEQYGFQVDVQALALTRTEALAESLRAGGIYALMLSKRFGDHLYRKMYRGYSEYDRFHVHYNDPYEAPIYRATKFNELVDAYKKRIKFDVLLRFNKTHYVSLLENNPIPPVRACIDIFK